MIKMNIAVNDQSLYQILAQLSPFGKNLPRTEGAAKTAASVIRDAWRGYAMGGSLGGIEKLKNPSGGYARSIKINQTGPLSYEIFSEAPIAEWLEKGTPAFDMKKTHTIGPRSRVSLKGYPYLIVPFRWGTPKTVGFRNVMPQSVYNIVKNKKKYRQTKTLETTHYEPNARGENVERHEYSGTDDKGIWGDQLKAEMGEDVTPNMVGMSNMAGQGGKSSGYFTFRVISSDPSANPRSWIHPGIRARPVTETVAQITKEPVSDLIDSALRGDLGL
ncbi:MAG: hypothetical protein LBD55_02115 [Treponema sp.]|jgi:hypothetical protein|nr:hypothetical protein [Treponema sp.]